MHIVCADGRMGRHRWREDGEKVENDEVDGGEEEGRVDGREGSVCVYVCTGRVMRDERWRENRVKERDEKEEEQDEVEETQYLHIGDLIHDCECVE